MSVQFGKWNFDGKPIDTDYLKTVNSTLVPYGPDSSNSYSNGGIAILYRAFHTVMESRREKQPFISSSGLVFTWDGRLDNRVDLITLLHDTRTLIPNPTDVAIVGTAYDRWGTECLSKLVGDWALSIWNPKTRSLILAKDPLGTRHLYYALDRDQITWSTVLEPLVLHTGRTFSLCEEYVAGWVSFFPAPHLTPYLGVHSLPPSSFALVEPRRTHISTYWDFNPTKAIRYRTDPEYEEHFRTVFAEAVSRRLRADGPVLAELSGGMDSSSIVCVADRLGSSGALPIQRIATISILDNAEPNWKEEPYIKAIEEKRGQAGFHIDADSEHPFRFQMESVDIGATPDSVCTQSEVASAYRAHVADLGARVVLAGLGGDEVTGGIPTFVPLLAELLTQGRFHAFAGHLFAIALRTRRPLIQLLFETLRAFLPPSISAGSKLRAPAPWLSTSFVCRHRKPLTGYAKRLHIFGPQPTFQSALETLQGLRRQLACITLPNNPPYEVRYPFLDRTLLEFLASVPPDQLVRPGERRSLMRRALRGIVPNEILSRKRKAYVARRPVIAIREDWAFLEQLCQAMVTSTAIVNADIFRHYLERARDGHPVPIVSLTRTIALEVWARQIHKLNVLGSNRKNSGMMASSQFDGRLRPSDSRFLS